MSFYFKHATFSRNQEPINSLEKKEIKFTIISLIAYDWSFDLQLS